MAAATTAALSVRPDQAWGATTSTRLEATRLIALHAQWSDERFVGPYMERGSYLPDALDEIAYLYRDRHNQTVHRMDVRVLDLLYNLRLRTGYRGSGAARPAAPYVRPQGGCDTSPSAGRRSRGRRRAPSPHA
jgi:uncharacterized protein YcbK (DUF882 family)